MRVEWKLVVLCWGVQHVGAQSTLQGDAFCFCLVFLRLNLNFSLQFLTPGGSLDLQGGGGCSKSITRGDSGMGLGGLRVHRLSWERRREIGWCWFLFLQPVTAPALNHQAQKTWAVPKGASPQACAACPGLCTAGIKGNSIWRWEKQPWQPFFLPGWQQEQSQGQISIWLICCWDGDTLESH